MTMNECKMLTIERLDKEEYKAAMKAVNALRQKRANEAAKMKVIDIITGALNESLNLVHSEELVYIVDDVLWNIVKTAKDKGD